MQQEQSRRFPFGLYARMRAVEQKLDHPKTGLQALFHAFHSIERRVDQIWWMTMGSFLTMLAIAISIMAHLNHW